MAPERIGICWGIHPSMGWGVYGYQIVRHLGLHSRFTPVMLEDIHLESLDKMEATIVSQHVETPLVDNPDILAPFKGTGRRLPIPLLRAFGSNVRPQFADKSLDVHGSHNHALTFFENAQISKEETEAYNSFSSVVAGSTWNGSLLKAAGVERTGVILQGIDPAQFHPAPKKRLFDGRFVVFAGGKMEFRKGQDIALAALKIFIQRHPETLLLCVWGNRWPSSWSYMQFTNSPHIETLPPPSESGELQIDKWFGQFGIGHQNVFAFKSYPHRETQNLMREADVALFPNRCEGGTNLVAMEAMACGIPTIISRNTGHLDIIHNGACLPIESQRAVPSPGPLFDTDGWGESSVEEIVEHLEFVYQNRDSAAEIGLRGAERMRDLSWARQVDELLTFVESHGLS